MEFDFSPLNENTTLRDNILNAEIGDVDVFSKLDSDASSHLVKAVNGIGFDNKGNIVGIDGKVVKTAADIRNHLRDHYNAIDEFNPLNFESIKIDDVAYTINDKGDAVDAEGKVVKTAAEVRELLKNGKVIDQAPTTLEGILSVANTNLGIEFKDEQGNDITFEPTVEGLQARDQYIIDNLVSRLTQEAVGNILAADNDIESLYLYKQQHGTSVGWTPAPKFDQIVLLKPTDANAEKQYLDLIVKDQIAKGQTPELAQTLAKYLIDDGKGEEMAKQSLVNLKAMDDKKIADERAINQQRIDEENARVEKYWNEVKSVVDKGTVMGVTIPAFIPVKQADGTVKNVPRSYVYEYMSKPVQDGKSAMQIAKANMSVEARIMEAVMSLTNYGYADIIKASVAANKVEAVRKTRAGVATGSNKNQSVGGKAPVDMVVLS